MRKIHGRQAQVSLDLIASISLFLIFFLFVLTILSQFNFRFSENKKVLDLEREALGISDIFVQSPGYPSGWEKNTDTAQVLGLSPNDHELGTEKVIALKNLMDTDYAKAQNLLGIEGQEFYFRVRSLNTTTITEAGHFPNTTATEHEIILQRRVLYKSFGAILEVGLWRG